MKQRIILVTAGILREGERILLVWQQEPEDPMPTWGLPGGEAQEGELLFEALKREVGEESGLEVRKAGEPAVAYLSGEAPPGKIWTYRMGEDLNARLEADAHDG